MIFRNAVPDEAESLSKLTIDSKRYWDYPEEYLALWFEVLEMNSEYIGKNMVVVAEEGVDLLGYISIIEEPPEHVLEVGNCKVYGGFFLDNLFVDPSHIKQGIGESLPQLLLTGAGRGKLNVFMFYPNLTPGGFMRRWALFMLESRLTGWESRCLL